MRILIGVCGEGLGHATRCSVIADDLQARGHEVRLASSGKAWYYLDDRHCGRVVRIAGLELVSHGGAVVPIATALRNIAAQAIGAVATLPSFKEIMKWGPDVVVSDLDPWSARVAALTARPLVSVGNIQLLTRCRHPAAALAGDALSGAAARVVTAAAVPWASRYLVTAIAYAEPVHEDTSIHAPILRRSVLEARGAPERDHVVAYLGADDRGALAVLQGVRGTRFVVYGQPNVTQELRQDNVTLRPFAEHAFTSDLATCRAVVGAAGFSLLSEAAYLHKPVLAVPLRGQAEQVLNAWYLSELGWGKSTTELTTQGVREFLVLDADFCRQKVSGYQHDWNNEFLTSLSMAIQTLTDARRQA